ncbi:FIMAH domain-containing protein [Virgibacillus salidurans]|uniref:FIMAH domain-containing protein n=1 Tax=Virgibacillus salidurans TaxID=2831673 RepID=UPI003F8EAE16
MRDNYLIYTESGEGDEVSATDIKTLVEDFEEAGEFTNNENAAHSLKLHLTAVEHFENQEAAEKVVNHMNSFKLLLDHQKDNEFISVNAYHTLQAEADALIAKWE